VRAPPPPPCAACRCWQVQVQQWGWRWRRLRGRRRTEPQAGTSSVLRLQQRPAGHLRQWPQAAQHCLWHGLCAGPRSLQLASPGPPAPPPVRRLRAACSPGRGSRRLWSPPAGAAGRGHAAPAWRDQLCRWRLPRRSRVTPRSAMSLPHPAVLLHHQRRCHSQLLPRSPPRLTVNARRF
jgi:hypothetical protein